MHFPPLWVILLLCIRCQKNKCEKPEGAFSLMLAWHYVVWMYLLCRLVQSSSLCCLWACSTRSCVWSGRLVVVTGKTLCHPSGRLLLFVEMKKRWSKWAWGGYLLLANIHCPQWSAQLPPWLDSWLGAAVCSQCKLLFNAIPAPKLFMAIPRWWRLQIPLHHYIWSIV